MKKPMSSMERKLANLSADILPYLGTAIGAMAGGVGAPVGSAIGGMAATGIKALIPPEEQQRQQYMGNQPMVFNGQGGGYINLNQQMQQQQMMDQLMQDPNGGMGQLGQGFGQLAGGGITALLGMLQSGGATPQQAMWGKMDDSLKEKLVRMVALKQALG